VKVIPDFGYYIKLIPKDNLIKNGYILTTNTIENYNNTLKIYLVKIEDTIYYMLPNNI